MMPGIAVQAVALMLYMNSATKMTHLLGEGPSYFVSWELVFEAMDQYPQVINDGCVIIKESREDGWATGMYEQCKRLTGFLGPWHDE
jgi:hypothetical protein